MGIERLRYWHWMIIGVLMGCIYATVKTQIGYTEQPNSTSYMVWAFEQMMMSGGGGEADLRNIGKFRIHPGHETRNQQTGAIDRADIITFEAVKVTGKDRKAVLTAVPGKSLPSPMTVESNGAYFLHSAKDDRREITSVLLKQGQKLGFKEVDKKTVAFVDAKAINLPEFDKGTSYVWKEGVVKGEPFNGFVTLSNRGTRGSVLGKVDTMSGREYLDKLKGYLETHKSQYPNHIKLDHKVTWLEIPRFAYAFYSAIGFVAIGVVWPLLLRLLVDSGYGRKYTDDEAYLARFNGGKEPEKAKAVVTEDDMEKLRALEAELEASLKSGDVKPAAAGAAVAKKPEIKKLDAGPLEQTPEQKKAAARKAFGEDQGDFYPTEVHGKQKH